MTTPLPALSLLETPRPGRAGEKQHTVADTVSDDLTLVAGCNQKTSRTRFERHRREVQATLDRLKTLC